MAYRTTEHKKAIIKMVKEKRIILQIDLATVMNKSNINDSVKSLVEEGKIKRQKIKNRGRVGNLTDVWVVYNNNIKQDEILEFEKMMISKPFVSPLVENHCYKRAENPVEQKVKGENYNVIDMQEYIKINNQDVGIIEYKGQRVVTFKSIDLLHNRKEGTAQRNFYNNKKHFTEGVHYFNFKGNDGLKALLQANLERFTKLKSPNFSFYLITENGYLNLVKSFEDDLSWKVQSQLVDCYFKVKEIRAKVENNLPITQQDFMPMQILEQMFIVMKEQSNTINNISERLAIVENKFKLLAQ